MICRMLLLIRLTSCVSGTFVVKVTQTSYQAEENHNITLEWTFTTKPDTSSSSLNIFCHMFTDHEVSLLYRVREGVEDPESQDQQFAGRVQCDKDALREGRIRLDVSRLRTGDSGWYVCEVLSTEYKGSADRCYLNVTAAVDQPKPQKPLLPPERRGSIGLCVGLTAAVVAVVCAGLCFAFRLCSMPNFHWVRQRHVTAAPRSPELIGNTITNESVSTGNVSAACQQRLSSGSPRRSAINSISIFDRAVSNSSSTEQIAPDRKSDTESA